MLQTIRIYYEDYRNKLFEAAILARKIQARVGHPLGADIKNMVRDNLLENCPFKIDHITTVKNISGPNVAGLRKEYVRTYPTLVKREYISIPKYFWVIYNF